MGNGRRPAGAPAGSLASIGREAAGRAIALVLDGRGLTDLGVVRSLGRAGITVWVAGPTPDALACRSRYVSEYHALPAVEASRETYVQAVSRFVGGRTESFVVFCTGDLTAGALADFGQLLPANARHHLADSTLVRACLSKSEFARLADDTGLRVPETRTCLDEATLTRALADFGELFVKPDNRHGLWTGDAEARAAAAGVKGFLVRSEAGIPSVVRRSLAGGYPWVAQRFVHGDARALVSVHAYRDRTGAWTEAFVGQKLRTAPPRDGIGVLARSVDDPEAVALARETLERMDYRGYALLQFKRDHRTGRLYLIEINPRYSTWCELAERAGVNLPLVAFLDALGALDEPPQLASRNGVYWWDAAGDRSNLTRRGARWRDRLAGFVPPAGRIAFARLARDDPRPGLATLPLVGRLLRPRWRQA